MWGQVGAGKRRAAKRLSSLSSGFYPELSLNPVLLGSAQAAVAPGLCWTFTYVYGAVVGGVCMIPVESLGEYRKAKLKEYRAVAPHQGAPRIVSPTPHFLLEDWALSVGP